MREETNGQSDESPDELDDQLDEGKALRALRRDLKKASETMGVKEVRFLVDTYYAIQEFRKGTGNQERALDASEEPHEVLAWATDAMRGLEDTIKSVLDTYTRVEPTGIGRWARGVVGIGPVLAAGLLAHIDITKAPTVGHIWSFAGLNPTVTWDKGQKRPWNAKLKTLCWKCSDSFVKQSGHEKCVYGHLYRQRKELEIQRNEAGLFADQARDKLAKFKIGKDTEAYKAYSIGKLPPGHLDARARRFAVKQFLADLHHAMYVQHYGTEPPLPYPIAMDPERHAHYRIPGTETYGPVPVR